MQTQQVVIAVIRKDDKFLLTKRCDLGQEDKLYSPYVWNLPGGGVENNETQKDALVREMKEELGVTVSNLRLISKVFYDQRGNWKGIFSAFVCDIDHEKDKIILNEEATEYGWFTLQEIKKLKTLPKTIEITEAANFTNNR